MQHTTIVLECVKQLQQPIEHQLCHRTQLRVSGHTEHPLHKAHARLLQLRVAACTCIQKEQSLLISEHKQKYTYTCTVPMVL